MSEIKHLTPDDYKLMPWKNGLGMTTEIAVMPHDPPRDDSPFLWRISIASVSEDGPFSRFANIDRQLMLIEGAGITLDGGKNGVGFLSERLQTYRFAGDIPIDARLVDGPIKDLNLMVDRRFAEAKMIGFYIETAERVMLKSDVHFIHLLEGSASVTLDMDGQLVTLENGDSLRIDGATTGLNIMRITDNEVPSACVFISIDLINGQ